MNWVQLSRGGHRKLLDGVVIAATQLRPLSDIDKYFMWGLEYGPPGGNHSPVRAGFSVQVTWSMTAQSIRHQLRHEL